jgi:hypothetical protein
MGMDLLSKKGDRFYFNMSDWPKILKLAFDNGWKPQGTVGGGLYEVLPDWDGNYFDNEGQWIEAEDAANIANALEREPKLIDNIEMKIFINFCRKGAFKIL